MMTTNRGWNHVCLQSTPLGHTNIFKRFKLGDHRTVFRTHRHTASTCDDEFICFINIKYFFECTQHNWNPHKSDQHTLLFIFPYAPNPIECNASHFTRPILAGDIAHVLWKTPLASASFFFRARDFWLGRNAGTSFAVPPKKLSAKLRNFSSEQLWLRDDDTKKPLCSSLLKPISGNPCFGSPFFTWQQIREQTNSRLP